MRVAEYILTKIGLTINASKTKILNIKNKPNDSPKTLNIRLNSQ